MLSTLLKVTESVTGRAGSSLAAGGVQALSPVISPTSSEKCWDRLQIRVAEGMFEMPNGCFSLLSLPKGVA